MAYMDTLVQENSKRLLYRVFGLMAGALTITGLTSFVLFMNPAIFAQIFKNGLVVFSIIMAQLAIVIALAGFIQRMNTATALVWYFMYSVLVGVSCSAILYQYQLSSIATTFFICAGTFATVALYGYLTNSDLSNWGSIATMGLFGLIIALLINIFLQNQTLDLILSFVGVAVFTVLTAVDVQRIKMLGYDTLRRPEDTTRIAIIGALSLYLDFINLFLMLLRIFGRKRD
jgi:uncharacterized protein